MKLRDRWLNPPEWVEWVDEPVPGYPKRPVARDEAAAKELKRRTLTNLYNARPQWLADAHAALDATVAAAYGWDAEISEDNALAQLLALNQSGRIGICPTVVSRRVGSRAHDHDLGGPEFRVRPAARVPAARPIQLPGP